MEAGTSCNITNPSVEDAILFARNIYQLQGDKVRLQKILIKGILLSVQLLFLNFVHITISVENQ